MGVLLGAFAYRMFNLTAQGFWIDEGFTWFLTQQPDLLRVLKTDVHPPLYFALISVWAGLTGTSEFSFRFFSVLNSVLAVACMVPLAREAVLMAQTRTPTLKRHLPLIAMGLLALSDMEIYTAQEARAYALHSVFVIMSMWAFLRWIRRHNTRTALVWALATVLLVYTHYWGAWVGVVQGLYVLLTLRGRVRVQAVLWLLGMGASVGVWVVLIMLPYQLKIVGINTTADPSTLETLFNYVRAFFSPQWALTISLIGVGFAWKARRVHGLLLLWLVLPVALTFILNAESSRLLFDYRLSQITPAVALLVAWGIAWFSRRVRVVLLLIITVWAVLVVDVYREKEDWLGYAREIAHVVKTGDGVVVDFGAGDYQMTYYLAQTLPDDVPVFALRQQAFTYPENYEGASLGFMDSVQRVWLVRWNTNTEAFDKLGFVGFTEALFLPLERENNINLDLYRFDRPLAVRKP